MDTATVTTPLEEQHKVVLSLQAPTRQQALQSCLAQGLDAKRLRFARALTLMGRISG